MPNSRWLESEIARLESKIEWARKQLTIYGTPSKYPNEIRKYKNRIRALRKQLRKVETPCIVFDLDDTLADTTNRRVCLLSAGWGTNETERVIRERKETDEKTD